MNSKDKSIELLVDRILKEFEPSQIKIKDYWEADLCAIGFSDNNEKHLVYVSTYGKSDNLFYVSLEILYEDKNSPYQKDGEFDNISYVELQTIISRYLIEN